MGLHPVSRKHVYYRELLQGKAHLVPESERQWWLDYLDRHMEHYDAVISRLQPPELCGPVLEIGSSPGHLTLMLSDMGYNLTAVDINPARLAPLWQAAGVDVRQVNIETERLPFADGQFGVVLFTEVLEHLRINPLLALSEVHRVTRAGGQLILSVPNITPRDRWHFLWGGDYQGDIIEEFKKLEKFGYMGHIRLYSRREVDRMLRHPGYRSISFARKGPLKGAGLWRPIKYLCGDHFRKNIYFVASRPDSNGL